MRNRGHVSLCVLCLACCWGCATAMVLHVPGEYGTIGDAVDAAAQGDTVEVAAGTYCESDIAVGRALTIRAAPDAWGCVTVDGGGIGRHFSITSLPFSISGLRLVGGRVSSGNGGSMSAIATGSVEVTGCVFESNYASSSGGAIYVAGGASLRVEDSCFTSNSVGTGIGECSGGAIYCRNGTADVSGSTFTGNVARPGTDGSAKGGGVSCLYGVARFTNCVFQDNAAEMAAYYYGLGGATYLNGMSGTAVFSNCVFMRNEADSGGAVAGGPAAFTSCVFISNAAGNHGATVWSTTNPLSFVNCTLVLNSGLGIIYNGRPVTLDHTIIAWSIGGAAVDGTSTATASCCCLFHNNGGSWVGPLEGQGSQSGNLSSNPRFCDVNGGDFRLDSLSPCAPPGPAGCGLIGALPVGCGASPVQLMSWGGIKSLWK
jgi:predicted outer membrane repeat protein